MARNRGKVTEKNTTKQPLRGVATKGTIPKNNGTCQNDDKHSYGGCVEYTYQAHIVNFTKESKELFTLLLCQTETYIKYE